MQKNKCKNYLHLFFLCYIMKKIEERECMRIVAGKHKGLKLETFEADNIRPTLDRAREGIFNKIQFLVPNAKCLDLFGGTGAISIECLSRGASSVIIADNNEKSCTLIKKNFANAKEKCNLITGDFSVVCDSLFGNLFDIIFLDPPFATNLGVQAIEKIVDCNLLMDDGIIVFEHSSEKKYIPADFLESLNLKIIDSKKYGYISVDYIKKV